MDMRWQIANEALSAELAIIISYPTSASGIIVLFKVSVKENEVPTEKNSSRAIIFATKASYTSN